ncbi:MAG: glycoside hydrolase family 127 protein [Treponema sp.]|jgi:DUF1680 family protein|nr:glycoside hydrolase family 127 protein [Treponema sp.]
MIKKNQQLYLADLKDIKLRDGFWKERLDVFTKVTIPDILDKFEKDRGGAFNNFKQVRDGKKGFHAGPPWYDGLVGECIRGISDFLICHYDDDMDKRLDGYIELMAEAQNISGDGFLNTYTTAMCPEHRFGRDGGNLLWQHDLYNTGCIVEAGVHHYRATGKVNLLTVACKLANYVVSQIGPEPKENIVPAHSLPEEAYLELYCLFAGHPEVKKRIAVQVHEEEYLKLVKFWLDMRGNHNNRKSYPRYMGEYAQDHAPLADQSEAAGHCVRAALLYTGLAEYVNITGDETYRITARRIWESITRRKMHISGNIGAIHLDEKFGFEYQLPNTAYLETCAGAAMLFFARSMFLAKGEREYFDVLEQALYNGVLPGVSIKGNEYFYRNPLSSQGDEKRWTWHTCPCCPPMFLKVMGEMPAYLYASDNEGIYVNLYAPSESLIRFGHREVKLIQETGFPWDGLVSLTVNPCQAGIFKIRLRIPPYSRNFSITINGKDVLSESEAGYISLAKDWKTGDNITLNCEIKPELWAAHPYVEDDEGRAAIRYGPLLYCVEGVENDMNNIVIPENYTMTVSPSKDFPGWKDIVFEDTRYREVRAIPYFAWANRGAGKMEVWLPVENFKKTRVEEWGDELYKPYQG